jgi:hypothetical protein
MTTLLRRTLLLIHLCYLISAAGLFPVHGATPLLERVVTVTLISDHLDVALQKISHQGAFTFSYNPASVDISRTVTATYTALTVREILDDLFQGSLTYKTRGNYIILTKAIRSPEASRVYSGYVVDESTGEKLGDVSVYDPVSLSSAVTDAYGYFQIKIDKPSSDLILSINKQNYADTVVRLAAGRKGLMRIPMSTQTDKIATLADSVGVKLKRFWMNQIVHPKSANIDNIQEPLYRHTQVSVLPFIGTNHKLSGNVINDYSYNIFAGYSRGVRKFELGGMFNVVGDGMEGTQLAGMANAVGGKMDGAQVAGMANLVRDSTSGPQLAGLVNLNWNSSHGFSAAGLINFTHEDATGIRLAGLSNMTLGNHEGADLAGLFNFATRDAKAAQVSGMLNFAGGSVRGAQVSSLLNFAGKEITGAQASGFINYATRVRGVQIGLVNIADSVSGLPIGLLSFVVHGYHQVEVSADEVFYLNVALRTGVRHFYNIFTGGIKPGTVYDDKAFWSFGYGVGTSPRINRWLGVTADLTTSQTVQGSTIEAISLLNKLYVGVEVAALPRLAVTAGFTLNGYLTDNSYTRYPDLFTDYRPEIIEEVTTDSDLNLKVWLGAKVGIRFF